MPSGTLLTLPGKAPPRRSLPAGGGDTKSSGSRSENSSSGGSNAPSICLKVRLDYASGDRLVCPIPREQALLLQRAYSKHADVRSPVSCRQLAFRCFSESLRSLGLRVLNEWKSTEYIDTLVGLLQGLAEVS